MRVSPTPLHVHAIGSPSIDCPIVALHGIRGWGGRWKAIPGLAAFAPDLRGHGRSTYEKPGTIRQHVDDVIRTLDHLRVERARVLGLSFGGLVALHLSLLARDRVARLTLLDPAVDVEERRARARRDGSRPAPAFSDAGAAFATRSKLWPRADPAMIEREIDHHLHVHADGRWRWRYDEAIVDEAFTHMAKPAPTQLPSMPATLVTAAAGSLVGQSFVARWRNSDKHLERIDSTHSMEVDDPLLVADVIARSLGGLT